MQPIYTQEEIQKIIKGEFSLEEHDNEYSRKRINDISSRVFFSSGDPGIRQSYEITLRVLRDEWIKEIQNVGNPYVLYTLNKRIVALRTILKKGF